MACVMYITMYGRPHDRVYVYHEYLSYSGMLVVLVWILFDFYHISLNLLIYPGYVRDIVMYITSSEDRYVGGSCVKLWSILSCT